MADHTPAIHVRMPRPMWTAYSRVCERLNVERSEDLLGYVRRQIEQHGDDTDRADLATAELELAERRARRGGRPRKDNAEPAGATDSD
jgi:hypothetical protein